MKEHVRYSWAYVPALSAFGFGAGAALTDRPVPHIFLALWGACSFAVTYWIVRTLLRERSKDEFTTRQLLQAQKMATIGEMASGIAHEVNNPLAVIGRETEWIQEILKEHPPPDSQACREVQESLQVIAAQVGRCAEITHRLLDFARKSEPVLQWVDLNTLIEEMVRLVERVTRGKTVTIQRLYQDTLAPVWTDPPLLRQVVLNLLNNAVQAIDTEGTVTVATRDEAKGWVDILIADTGCGIAPHHLPHLFDPFFSTKAPQKGTGLGLAVCQKIVTALGGLILVDSKEGCGSQFTVRLPRRPTTSRKTFA